MTTTMMIHTAICMSFPCKNDHHAFDDDSDHHDHDQNEEERECDGEHYDDDDSFNHFSSHLGEGLVPIKDYFLPTRSSKKSFLNAPIKILAAAAGGNRHSRSLMTTRRTTKTTIIFVITTLISNISSSYLIRFMISSPSMIIFDIYLHHI